MPNLRTREVVPRTLHPNFRDHRRMVDRPLLNVVANLQRYHGEAWASEAGLRRMVCEDSGHMPGVDTIPCALERLEKHGILTQEWLAAGGLLPTGGPCARGTRLIVIPRCRRSRYTLAAKNRRDHVTGRSDPRHRVSLEEARARIAKRLTPRPLPEATLDRARDKARADLADLERQWANEATARAPDKPPE